MLAALAALGLALNGAALARRQFAIRTPLRVIACGVALIVLAGVMAMWQWLRKEYLPEVPVTDVARSAAAVTISRNLVWIAAALSYVIVTILVLPGAARQSGPRTGKTAGRDDSRRLRR